MGFMDWVHGGLDVAGMVPVIGTAADLVNAGIYAAEGDVFNASVSLAGALPGGQVATAARRAGAIAKGGKKALGKVAKKTTKKKATKEGAKDVGTKVTKTKPKVIRRLGKAEAREELMKRYPKRPGDSVEQYEKFIDSNLNSIDWEKPDAFMEIVEFKKGDQLDMWVENGTTPGSYAADIGTDPNTLGIQGGKNRHLERVTFNENTTAIRGGPVKDNVILPGGPSSTIGGPGGGVQYQLGTNSPFSTTKI